MYVFRASLNPDIDDLSIQFRLPRFHIYRVICDVLERDGRITEAIECFQQMQRELREDMSIRNEKEQWELSERYCEQCNQRLPEHGTQVFNGDAQTGWRNSPTPQCILATTTKPQNTSRLYCRSTQQTG